MYRLVGSCLARGLRAVGRRARGRPACLLPRPAGGRPPGLDVPPGRGAPGGRGRALLPLLAGPLPAALAWFSRPAEAEEARERRGAGGDAAEDVAAEAEAEIVQLLKRAKLSIMKDELEEAELLLHDALRLAFKSDNKKAVTYTYDLEDNVIIEISLKLASIYAAQNRQDLALAGYEFCISTLEEKIGREKESAEDVLSVEEKADTQLLLGMCLDACARYLLLSERPSRAQRMYERALQISEEILGERHPQTIVLMSDLATTLDAQGRFDEACVHAQRASDLARQMEHPELHVLLSNLAAVLMHREQYAQARELYQEALKRAELRRDELSAQHIREELAELARKSRRLP
ncbi:tetratricopeptide repeat protein 19, mitochondrial isoform X5 [Camelus ferus]|uniref:Tetratricopeptide repeat protein 19, mitochondrial n=1 Tax=Camelus ferus TaxID=419612 RepID=A0A8B8UK85_CAMFR|nr:tetratricopeptide repeat protein 19, mitochondrial isoform X5 [Camelus ferus]